MDCRCVNAKVSVSGDIRARVSCDKGARASLSVGTVTIRDGTNDYGKLVNKPSIEGVTLQGDKGLDQLGLSPVTLEQIDRWFFE